MKYGTLILSSLLINIKMGEIKYFYVFTRWRQFQNADIIQNVFDLVRYSEDG
ncbi:MAG: hypothetical protein GY714_19310 [Desulfobacterales bacterium]|nr:hypothetical protein [Desulfobacterales bacterium]